MGESILSRSTIVDSALSTTSTNPVQNKILEYAIANKLGGWLDRRVYKFIIGNGDKDIAWKKIFEYNDTAAATNAAFNGCTVFGRLIYQSGNYYQGNMNEYYFQAAFTGYSNSSTQSNKSVLNLPPSLNIDMIRIVQVATNHWELQVRQPANYTQLSVEFSFNNKHTGGSPIATVCNPVDATNTTNVVNDYQTNRSVMKAYDYSLSNHVHDYAGRRVNSMNLVSSAGVYTADLDSPYVIEFGQTTLADSTPRKFYWVQDYDNRLEPLRSSPDLDRFISYYQNYGISISSTRQTSNFPNSNMSEGSTITIPSYAVAHGESTPFVFLAFGYCATYCVLVATVDGEVTTTGGETVTIPKAGYYVADDSTLTLTDNENVNAFIQNGIPIGVYENGIGAEIFNDYTQNQAKSNYSSSHGRCNIAENNCQAVFGQYARNVSNSDLFIVGWGTSSARSNAFRVTTSGGVYGKSAYATGADYAEYFEWADGNPNNEDRRGLFVTLDGEKIKLANPDDYILGVVSAAPGVIGDAHEDSWSGKYLKDSFGSIIYEDVEVPDNDNIFPVTTHIEKHPKYNPDYNFEEEYIPRSQRPEWNTVGFLGKLVVCDDGTCEVNGFCNPANGGVATKSDTGYRVMARIDENHIKILLK